MVTHTILIPGREYDPDERGRDMQHLSKRSHEMLQQITAAKEDGQGGKLHRLVHGYLTSEIAQLWAASRALRKATNDQIRSLVAAVDPYANQTDVVSWRRVPKRSGYGSRPVCELPATLQANHYMIADVLRAQVEPYGHIFDFPGRGRERAALAVKGALEAGYDRCFNGDVANCYQHATASTLPDHLSIPRRVVEKCLDPHNLYLRRHDTLVADLGRHDVLRPRWNGPRGLLQGSPASSIILAVLFNSMVLQIAPLDCRLITSSDNLFVAARCDATLMRAMSLIRGYLHDHPAGPFDLKDNCEILPPGDEFEFLGYRFVPTEAGVLIEPGECGELRMSEAIEDAIERDISRGEPCARESRDVIHSHFSGYRSITNWEERRDEALEEADDEVGFAGVEELVDHLVGMPG